MSLSAPPRLVKKHRPKQSRRFHAHQEPRAPFTATSYDERRMRRIRRFIRRLKPGMFGPPESDRLTSIIAFYQDLLQQRRPFKGPRVSPEREAWVWSQPPEVAALDLLAASYHQHSESVLWTPPR